jgi:UDP-sugar transporter A1/2/3
MRARDNVTVKNTLHTSESISAVDITALSPNSANKLHNDEKTSDDTSSSSTAISKMGLSVLILLAFQNCSKNLLLRFVMKEHPKFLTSAAVIGVEFVKLVLCLLYIAFIEKQSLYSAIVFIRQDRRNTLLMGVPAALYSSQMTLEYVALGNLDAAVFSVLVQTKLLATAGCAVLILRKKIRKVQLISLVLLTVGVMLCNMKDYSRNGSGGRRLAEADDKDMDTTKGIIATLCISACSGFASVYTEKVIKAKRNITSRKEEEELPLQMQNQEPTQQPQYGLVYTQVQLAFVSLVIMGFYCTIMELEEILQKGLWYGFNFPAYVSIFVSAIGGLTVAAGEFTCI